jgi:hypothetical protein
LLISVEAVLLAETAAAVRRFLLTSLAHGRRLIMASRFALTG